jgi:hypothetical protein
MMGVHALGVRASGFAMSRSGKVACYGIFAAAVRHANISVLEGVISSGAETIVIENEVFRAALLEP